MFTMKRMKLIVAITLAITFSGCGYQKMSSEEAIRYQTAQLMTTTKTLYASQPSIPDGDLTKTLVAAGGAFGATPDVYNINSEANQRDIDAMLRLTVNMDAGQITNEFGGSVKVISKAGRVSAIYTKVPASINCASIANVICEKTK